MLCGSLRRAAGDEIRDGLGARLENVDVPPRERHDGSVHHAHERRQSDESARLHPGLVMLRERSHGVRRFAVERRVGEVREDQHLALCLLLHEVTGLADEQDDVDRDPEPREVLQHDAVLDDADAVAHPSTPGAATDGARSALYGFRSGPCARLWHRGPLGRMLRSCSTSHQVSSSRSRSWRTRTSRAAWCCSSSIPKPGPWESSSTAPRTSRSVTSARSRGSSSTRGRAAPISAVRYPPSAASCSIAVRTFPSRSRCTTESG